jgi:nitronate monooxygenase
VAALALGAEGVLMGTRFMATKESPAHPRLKEAMLAACEKDTFMIQRSLRNPVRVWANQQARKVLEMEERGAGLEELLAITGGDKNARVMLGGELEAGCVTFGQVVGQVRDIPSAGQVIEQIMREALDIRDRLRRE